ncbi:MAG: hypothetical protein H0V66_04565, partial [Bdellovibrionales bacterium]|nr:hypothetical protein [Bdellovibrionales bacterium]
MKKLIFLSLCISSISFAQPEVKPGVTPTPREQWAIDKHKNDEWEKSIQKNLKQAEDSIAKKQAELSLLDDLEKNKKVYVAQAIDQAEAAIEDLSSADRLISRKAAFFRCIKNDLKDRGLANIPLCKSSHPANFSVADEKLIKEWNEKVTQTPTQIKLKKEQIQREFKSYEIQMSNAKVQATHAEAMKKKLQDTDKMLVSKEADQKLIEANRNFVNCDAESPEISLEEKVPYPGAKFKGPFFEVPRDNQDGMGTCYANTAKNLLVGTSQGKDVASFLDLA